MNIKGKVQTFLDIFSAASVLADEARIEKKADYLTFRGMDPAHIAMLDISYPAPEFETFEGEAKLGVRTTEITKILKRFDKKSSISLSVADSMLIMSDGQRVFRNRLIEASASSTPLPKLDFKSKVEMDKAVFDKALGDVQVVSERVTFETKNGLMELSGSGDTGEVALSLDAEPTIKEESKATYSLDYLIKMVKAVGAEKVTLEYSNNMPIKLTMGYISYYLAPRTDG